MMSLSANYRLFHSSFRHILPQEDFVKLANNCLDKKWLPTGKMFIWSNLAQNPSQMSVRTFARLKNIQCATKVLRLAMEYADGDK